MHPQLSLLLEIQDLRSQIRELRTGEAHDVEKEHFRIESGEAADQLEQKAEELQGQLEPAVRRRYERIARSMNRVVAPVINGMCYGCFMSIPTATARDHPNEALGSCENCGRFIYILP